MIFPTGNLDATDRYKVAMSHRNRTHIKMVFQSGITLTDADIDLSVGVKVSATYNKDSTVKFGGTPCREFSTRILINDNTRNLRWTEPFKLSFGVEEDDSNVIWVDYGWFYGEKPKKTMNVTASDFTAYDAMSKLDILADDYIDGWTSGYRTAETVLGDLCTTFDMAITQDLSFDMWERNVQNRFDADNTTYRDILRCIGEATGTYARMHFLDVSDRNRLEMESPFNRVWDIDPIMRDSIFSEEHSDMYEDYLTWDEFDQMIWQDAEAYTWNEIDGCFEGWKQYDGIYVAKIGNGVSTKYPTASKGNMWKISNNPFLVIGSNNKASQTTQFVKPLYDRLYGDSTAINGILPMTVECYGDFMIEAGDRVRIEVEDGVIVWMPIFHKEMHWNGMPVDHYETIEQ